MADASTLALRAAARVLARITRIVAARHTRAGAAAVNTRETGRGSISVRAGSPGGPWGWVPIQAFMIDNNARHPLYGNRGHWYAENDGGARGVITGEAAAAGADPAVRAWADTYVAVKFR